MNSLNLDTEADSFDSLLQHLDEIGLIMQDIGNLDGVRDSNKLIASTFNLNPALDDIIKRVTLYREDHDKSQDRKLKNYIHSKREPTKVLIRELTKKTEEFAENTKTMKTLFLDLIHSIVDIIDKSLKIPKKDSAKRLLDALQDTLEWQR